jgi:hypothetical protein
MASLDATGGRVDHHIWRRGINIPSGACWEQGAGTKTPEFRLDGHRGGGRTGRARCGPPPRPPTKSTPRAQESAASIAAAVCSPIEGIQCEYRSNVIAIELWPSNSCTSLGWTFALRRRVAAVCLRSWNRMLGSPARFRSGLKLLSVTVDGRTSVPVRVANIRPLSSHAAPAFRRSSPWRAR